ncbi:hypothetical protein JCM8547_008715 [Rhodosporidiobolus lusitaniae]
MLSRISKPKTTQLPNGYSLKTPVITFGRPEKPTPSKWFDEARADKGYVERKTAESYLAMIPSDADGANLNPDSVSSGAKLSGSNLSRFADDLAACSGAGNLLAIWEQAGKSGGEGEVMRRTAALKGLMDAGSTCPGSWRDNVPDFTLKRLELGDGYPVLLKHFFPLGTSDAKGVFNDEIVSDKFDTYMSIGREAEFGKQVPRATQYHRYTAIIHRHVFLLILCSSMTAMLAPSVGLSLPLDDGLHRYLVRDKPFYGTRTSSANPLPAKNPHVGVEDWYSKEFAEQAAEGGMRTHLEEHTRALRRTNTHKDVRCLACGRKGDEVEELVKEKKDLSYCSKCKPLHREIRYCSRDCQVRHFKTHKMICGKEILVAFPAFPPRPAPPALPYGLQWQLARQKREPTALYHVLTMTAISPSGAVAIKPRSSSSLLPFYATPAEFHRALADAATLLSALPHCKVPEANPPQELIDVLIPFLPTLVAQVSGTSGKLRPGMPNYADIVHQVAKDFGIERITVLSRPLKDYWKELRDDDWVDDE